MNRLLLLATLMATLALAMSLPAMADRQRSGYQPQVHHHYYQERRADRGRHHYQKRHKATRSKHRHRTPSRVVEHHYHSSPPRYRESRRDSRRYHPRNTDIPLVTVGGYPAVRIRVNH